MRGVLRVEALWVETFTGLRMDRFVKLVKVVRERGGNGPGGGRVIHRPRPRLTLEPTPRPVTDTGRLWIVDGTLVPVRDRGVGASSRNHRFSANVQVLIDADTRLVIATARPVPGNNAAHRWVRARVEHTFARMRNPKILRDCRQKGPGLHHAVQVVATLHNLALTG
ncbi:hypothetical protein [Streptomyces sp. NPDC054863]